LDIVLRAMIYGVRVYDPISLGIVITVLLGVTGMATYLPARRASRVDPTVALRCE
jgi:ABC-type lipoprotein release transport system permease subunit